MARFVSTVVLVLFGVMASALDAAAQAPGEGPSRQDYLKAFKELREQAKEAFPSNDFGRVSFGKASIAAYQGNGRVSFLKMKGARIGDAANADVAKMMVQIWGELLDDDDRLTGVRVNLGKHVWKANESFALFLETAVPIHVGIYQDFAAAESVQVLPHKEFPESYAPVKAGKAVRFPVNLQLDPGNDDELVSLVIAAVGTEPGLTMNPKKHKFIAFSKDYDNLFKTMAKEAEARGKLSTFAGTAPSARNVEDVSTIAFGPERFGYLQLRLRKKR